MYSRNKIAVRRHGKAIGEDDDFDQAVPSSAVLFKDAPSGALANVRVDSRKVGLDEYVYHVRYIYCNVSLHVGYMHPGL